MKTRHLMIIAIIAVAAIAIASTYMIFNPAVLPHSVEIGTHKVQNLTVFPTSISEITIPPGAEDPTSGKNYEPKYLVVTLGVNNTVRWTNKSHSTAHTVMAQSHDDPGFWNFTHSDNGGFLYPGKSFNFTFTKIGEFQYYTEPHPWMFGWVLVLPQSNEGAFQTVTLNSSSGIPDPCETFTMPCPFHPSNYTFTAQKFGPDIYIEKVTGNGVDNYAVIKPGKTCYYPTRISNSCTNPDDLAILRLAGVDTSVPQENIHVTITGLAPSYLAGEPIDFSIAINGFGRCDIPSVLVTHQGYFDWQSKTSWPSDTTPCETGMLPRDMKRSIGYLGGPIYINQSGTYLVHVGYSSNMTEQNFNVTSQEGPGNTPLLYSNYTYAGFQVGFEITGKNKLLLATLDKTGAIILSTHATEDGNLTLTLGPDLAALAKNGKTNEHLVVLTNGQITPFREITANQDMVLTIPFHSSAREIEIVMSKVL